MTTTTTVAGATPTTAKSTMTTNALGGNYLGGAAAKPMTAATGPTPAAGTSGTTPDALGTPGTAPTSTAIPTATPGAPGAAPPSKYSMSDIVRQITQAESAGQGAQAYGLFNGIASQNYGGRNLGGALDSALRQVWGADKTKQFINGGDLNYKLSNFDPRTGATSSDGSQPAMTGWDPSRWDPSAVSQWQQDWFNAGGNVNDPAVYNDPAALASAVGKQDAWVKNWAQSMGGTGYSPSAALAAENAAFRASHGMDANGNVIGVGQNNGQPGTGAGSGLGAGGNFNPGNTQNMPGPSPAPAPRPTNRFDAPSQPSSVYSNSGNMGRPLTLGGGQVGGGMGRPLRAADV